jgi:hypothetical protein
MLVLVSAAVTTAETVVAAVLALALALVLVLVLVLALVLAAVVVGLRATAAVDFMPTLRPAADAILAAAAPTSAIHHRSSCCQLHCRRSAKTRLPRRQTPPLPTQTKPSTGFSS